MKVRYSVLMWFPNRSRILLPILAALLLLCQSSFVNFASAQSSGQFYLTLNETAIGASLTGSYYPAGSVVTVQSSMPQSSPWCITWAGTGSGSFSGIVYYPATSFNVTMGGPISETANFTQCGSIVPPLNVSIKSSPPPPGSGAQATLTANWSGGLPPYNVELYSGSSPICRLDTATVNSTQGTWYNSFILTMSQNAPTYYCLKVSDSAANTTLLPSVFVSAVAPITITTSVRTTASTTVTVCSSPGCSLVHYTVATTTIFPNKTTISTSITTNSTVPTTSIPTTNGSSGNVMSWIINSIEGFFRGLFGQK